MSTQKIDFAFKTIKEAMDEACKPERLTLSEYLEVLEQLEEEIRERRQMVKQDIKATEEPDVNDWD